MTVISRRIADDYLALIERFPLRPIRNAEDYDAAAALIDELSVRNEDTLSDGEQDYFDALTLIVEAFDDEHFRIKPTGRSPLQRLKSLMKSGNLSPSRLGDLIGSRPAASMVLKGRRELSKTHIQKLSRYFGVSPAVFL